MIARCALLLLGLSGCAAPPAADPDPDPDPEPGTGHVTFSLADEVYRIAAAPGAVADNLSRRLGGASRDRWLTQSAGGGWLVMSAERFDCAGECLVRLSSDLADGEAVKPGGADVYLSGVAAISDDGNTVVYPASDGPHQVDLFVTTRSDAGWAAPIVLTTDSTYGWNNMPALSHDGAAVLFDCGAAPYPESGGNHACRVGLDGAGFTVVMRPDALPDPRNDHVQNPHDGPDGLVFESSWPIAGAQPETIWRLPPGSDTPVPLSDALDNAVSPCALPDGRIVLLWLGGNDAGRHELVVVDADGGDPVTLTPGVDVLDIGVGCGG